MPVATTDTGPLVDIENCTIVVPNGKPNPIVLNNLPDITDSKSVSYNDESIIGRTTPIKTFSHSENRTISMQIHLFVTDTGDLQKNLDILRTIESAAYTRAGSGGAPFIPPPVCKITCGALLGDGGVCVVMKSYSVKFPPDVVWAEGSLLPFKFDIDTSWDVVYSSEALPGQQNIITSGV